MTRHSMQRSRGLALLALCATTQIQATTSTSTSASTSTTTTSTKLRGTNNNEDDRQLFGREFQGGLEAIMASHVDLEGYPIPQAQAPEDTDNELVGLPVSIVNPVTGEALPEIDQSDITLRIVGGEDSQGQRNFCMHLRFDVFQNEYQFAGCGGTLISNCHVLSAAHCSADNRAGLPDAVYCNAFNPFNSNKDNSGIARPFHFSPIQKITPHPLFDNPTNVYDVSVLEMEFCADIGSYPVMKLADQQYLDNEVSAGDEVIVSGFGRKSEDAPSTVNTALQQVKIPYIPKNVCKGFFGSKITDDMFCAGQAQGGIDACQGDSGGPLFVPGPNGDDVDQVQIGIVSWGSGCARANRPGVYASVPFHLEWIKAQTCNDPRVSSSVELCTGSNPPPTSPPSNRPTLRPTNKPTLQPSSPPTDRPTPPLSTSTASASTTSSSNSQCSYFSQSCLISPCCGSLDCVPGLVSGKYCSISNLGDLFSSSFFSSLATSSLSTSSNGDSNDP